MSFGHLYFSRNLSFLSKLSNLGWQSTFSIFEDLPSSSLHCFQIQNPLSSLFVFLHVVCLFLKNILFIYYFWLCWVFVAAHRLSLVAAMGVALLLGTHRLLTAVASLGELRLQAQSLWLMGSAATWHVGSSQSRD